MFASKDHPRSRGVYCAWCAMLASRGGSSPLARGLPEWYEQMRAEAGIIPARAGFTVGSSLLRQHRPGSSPLARGLPRPGPRPEAPPADHPRSRGVYMVRPTRSVIGVGSSPLARGLHRPLYNEFCDARIIPARAGFTRDYTIRTAQKKDHPRSRGVYPEGDMYLKAAEGSSPLARGLRPGSRC